MQNQDIRWKRRFSNFAKSFYKLIEIELDVDNQFSDIEKEGFIHRFEFRHELAWNVMKDFLKEKGIQGIIGSKDATKLAFQNELIDDGQVWMDMIESRNQTVHTYNDEILEVNFDKIKNIYCMNFKQFFIKMKSLE